MYETHTNFYNMYLLVINIIIYSNFVYFYCYLNTIKCRKKIMIVKMFFSNIENH